MKKSDASQGRSASELISNRIAELGGWRGTTLGRMRKLIKATWMGTPLWSQDGNVRRAIDTLEGEKVDESAFKALVREAVARNGSSKSRPSKKAKF